MSGLPPIPAALSEKETKPRIGLLGVDATEIPDGYGPRDPVSAASPPLRGLQRMDDSPVG